MNAENNKSQSETFLGYRTDRPDGRYISTLGFKHAYLKALKPKLAFDPEMSAEEYPLWKQKVQAKLKELLRFPEDVPPQPTPKKLWSQPRDGYRIEKWECYPEPFSVVPYLVLIPNEATTDNPLPAVMCFSGSRSSKELLAGEPELFPDIPPNAHPEANKMALHFVRAGFISVAVENPGVGETLDRSGNLGADSVWTSRNQLSRSLISLGRTYIGLSVFQKMVMLEWLKTHDIVDAKRIAVSGHSLGTEPAMCMAVLDPDICAVVTNDFICSWQNEELALAPTDDGVNIRFTMGIWHIVPDMMLWLDLNDILTAVAPTPQIVLEGAQTLLVKNVRRAYELSQASESFELHYMEKYGTLEKRLYDDIELPEGLTQAEYLERVNVAVGGHYFKRDIAIPWLQKTVNYTPSKNLK